MQKGVFLRFLSPVPSLSLCCKRPRRNQGRTKEGPINSQTQKSTFIKIALLFLSYTNPSQSEKFRIISEHFRLVRSACPLNNKNRFKSDYYLHLCKKIRTFVPNIIKA